MRHLLAALAAALLAPLAFAADPPAKAAPAADGGQAKEFFFQPKDRVMFLGDSITEQYQYSSYMELYLTLRFPKAEFVFLNSGISGDTANGGAGRFQKHVLDEKPTALTINFGMNDGGYGKFDEGRNKQYREKTEAMLKMAADAKVRVALCSPNAVDVRPRPNLKEYLETQKQFYAPLKEIAEKYKVPFADQYAVTRAAMEKMTADDPKAEKVNPFPDGVHTSGAGGLFMAHAILTQLHAPATVSHAYILTGAKGETPANKGCKVDDQKGDETGVTFTRTDDALPMPVQKDWRSVLPYTNELKDLNFYGLSVSGLKEGGYDVLCDDVKVGTFTAKELAAGVNLGNAEAGPLFDQGTKVLNAINKKNEVVHQRFRGVVMANVNLPEWVQKETREAVVKDQQAELAKRMAKIDDEQKKVWELARPTPHKWEVRAAK
jgi:lysophospholipase L1-like esterase